jgi:hypothetical protein
VTVPNTPATPRKSPSGFRVETSVRNDCATFTVLWLCRYNAGRSAWQTVTETHVHPGRTARLELPCRGEYAYRAVHFDPNMLFHACSPVVELAG